MNLLFHGNKLLFVQLFQLALPIIIQNFILYSLNFIDTLMIGQLDETAIAAVGVANQFSFFFFVIQFGVQSGISIFTAQYWGKRDIVHIRKLVGIGYKVGLSLGSVLMLFAMLCPSLLFTLFSDDPHVISEGIVYLRIVAISYPATVLTFIYTFSLRSTEKVVLPLISSTVAVMANIVLNYLLIFGKFGFPALGVTGAGIGTCLARCLECILIILFTYVKRYPSAASLHDILSGNRPFFKRVFKTIWPVIFHGFIWALGFSIYNLIYSQLGTKAFAAVNICSSIQNMAMILFMGISSAASIMVGKCIGSGRQEEAYISALKIMLGQLVLAVLMGFIIIGSRSTVLSFYNVSAITLNNAHQILLVSSMVLWGKVMNMGLIIGIFRGGGDTKFGLFLDLSGVWLVGIPMGLLGAFVLHLPVYWVMAMVVSEEIFKILMGIPRFFTKRWIRNLVTT